MRLKFLHFGLCIGLCGTLLAACAAGGPAANTGAEGAAAFGSVGGPLGDGASANGPIGTDGSLAGGEIGPKADKEGIITPEPEGTADPREATHGFAGDGDEQGGTMPAPPPPKPPVTKDLSTYQ